MKREKKWDKALKAYAQGVIVCVLIRDFLSGVNSDLSQDTIGSRR